MSTLTSLDKLYNITPRETTKQFTKRYTQNTIDEMVYQKNCSSNSQKDRDTKQRNDKKIEETEN